MTIELGSFPVALFLVFLILKLCGAISWSWWYVAAPLWVPVTIVALLVLSVLLTAGK